MGTGRNRGLPRGQFGSDRRRTGHSVSTVNPALMTRCRLFDHDVGKRANAVWERETKRVGGLQIEYELELCRPDDR